MFFALPWMLLGLIGLPALAGIYWLRSRARPKTVSSLFLWADQKQPRQGGRVFQKLQTPLTFFLEMLALACLALAAASPAFIRNQQARPLVIVLDDSYSMQGVSKESSRQRGLDRVEKELRRRKYVARVILSGQRPRTLSTILRSPDQLEEVAREWTCRSPLANLESAISLAAEIGGVTSRILVVSDHEPQFNLPANRLQWWSVGQPVGNIAITAASRESNLNAAGDPEDRVLIEVTNLGNKAVRTELRLEQENAESTGGHPLELAAGAASRLILNMYGTDDLIALLPEDTLAIDNRALLISPRRQPLRVQVAIEPAAEKSFDLRGAVIRGLNATGLVQVVQSRPDLVITDRAGDFSLQAHQLQLMTGPDPASFDGPFVVDRTHILMEGLALDALVWTVGEKVIPTGTPVILAGNRVLMTDTENISGKHLFQLAIQPELSTLTESPDWPILMMNLVRWSLSNRPGPNSSNVHLGATLKVNLTDEAVATGKALVTLPDATQQTIPVHTQQLDLQAEQTGKYQVKSGNLQFAFASNALQAEESDLRKAQAGEWGKWDDSGDYKDQQVNLDWAFILVVLACLTAELAILAQSGGSGT